MPDILAKKVLVIDKKGHRSDYTHITYIWASDEQLFIHGETDDVDGTRINVKDAFEVEDTELMIVEFHKPKL